MMTDSMKDALSRKLDPKHVQARKQSGRSLSYIEGWHAIAEANRIFGFDAWTRETIEMRCVAETPRKIGDAGVPGFGVSYLAKVRVTACGIVREGYGTGHGIDRDLGLAHESALKEAETDAMKRALMTFGNPFGLALYDKSKAMVGDPGEEDHAPHNEEPEAPARKSAYALKKNEGERWPDFERDIRACKTPHELDLAWKLYAKEMEAWPRAWQEKADEEFLSQLDAINSNQQAAE